MLDQALQHRAERTNARLLLASSSKIKDRISDMYNAFCSVFVAYTDNS